MSADLMRIRHMSAPPPARGQEINPPQNRKISTVDSAVAADMIGSFLRTAKQQFVAHAVRVKHAAGKEPMTKRVLIASGDQARAQAFAASLIGEFEPGVVAVSDLSAEAGRAPAMVVLDSDCSSEHGIDVLMNLLGSVQVPVLMLTAPDEARVAIEALRCGAAAYVVKSGDYHNLLAIALKEMRTRANHVEDLKRAVVQLRREIASLKEQLAASRGGAAGAAAARGGPSNGQVAAGGEAAVPPAKATLLQQVTRQLASEAALPTYSPLASRLREMVCADQAAVGEVASLIGQDPLLSMKLLQMANSALYAGGGPAVTTVENAISRIGMRSMVNVVEIVANRAHYMNANQVWLPALTAHWENGLQCAWASRIIAERLRLPGPDAMFSLGLLCGVGRLVLLHVLAQVDPEGDNLATAEKEAATSGFIETHQSRFGAAIMKRRELAQPFRDAALHAEEPLLAKDPARELLVVHAGLAVTRWDGAPEGLTALAANPVIAKLGLDAALLTELRDQAAANVEVCRAFLF